MSILWLWLGCFSSHLIFIRGSTIKYTIESVKEVFANGNCTLLETVYQNNRTRMKYICECKNRSQITLTAFLKGQRCKDCGTQKSLQSRVKYTIESVKTIFLDNDCMLLEEKYLGYHRPMKYICTCGEKSKIRLADFLNGQRCQDCKGRKLQKHFSDDYDSVKEYFLQHDCHLLSKECTNNSQDLRYICECGKVDTITYKKFKQGQRCRDCGVEKSSNSRKLEYKFVKQCFEERECILISNEYIDSKSYLDYICHCGNVHSISFSNFFYHNQDCDKCREKKVSGENSPLWNPNITQEEREDKRKYPEYRRWTVSVFSRDDYTCQCCNRRGGKLHAHHIYNYSQHKDLRTDVSNGVALCKDCHRDFHNTYGYQDNDEHQLKEYIEEIQSEIFSLSTE